ncbi:MAG: DUF2281 domain-containing protein [Anaerolineae bacterium]|nr:DUF2281 domain-containing protein [Anaerolineae bacterium]
MVVYTHLKSRDYARAIAELVATLPPERAAQVYDFARFLQSQAVQSNPAEEDDWLNDTEAELQAEDARWQAFYERNQAEFLRLRERALGEVAAGETEPLFDENGDLTL